MPEGMRMKRIGVLLAGAGLIIGAILSGRAFVGALAGLSPDVAAAVIGSVGTILAGVFGVIWNQRSIERMRIRESHRPHKTEAYKNFVANVVIKTLKEGKKATISAKGRREMVEVFHEFTGDALVWASPGFIKAYKRFRQTGQDESQQVLVYLDDMLREMRSDLGHDDHELKRGDLIKLFITDADAVDRLLEGVDS